MEAGTPATLDTRGRTRPSAEKASGRRLGLAHARLVPERAIGPFWPRSPRVRMRGRDEVLAPQNHGCKGLRFAFQGLAAVSEWLLGRGCSGRRGSGADGAAAPPASGRGIHEAGEAAAR